jgi:hypothetical protein
MRGRMESAICRPEPRRHASFKTPMAEARHATRHARTERTPLPARGRTERRGTRSGRSELAEVDVRLTPSSGSKRRTAYEPRFVSRRTGSTTAHSASAAGPVREQQRFTVTDLVPVELANVGRFDQRIFDHVEADVRVGRAAGVNDGRMPRRFRPRSHRVQRIARSRTPGADDLAALAGRRRQSPRCTGRAWPVRHRGRRRGWMR